MRPKTQVDAAIHLIAMGYSDREIAQRLTIPRRTISDWRRGRNRIRSRTRDGQCLGHDLSALPAPEYAYLLGIYLGDGYISAGQRGVWRLRVTLDAAYPAIIEECRVAMAAVLPCNRAHVGRRSMGRCVDVSMWSKHWPCLIPQHGPGRKHLREISLFGWQDRSLKENVSAFCAVLYIAMARESSRLSARATTFDEPLATRSATGLAIYGNSFARAAMHWGSAGTQPSENQIAIYRQASVAILDCFVGPKR
jgi:transcriptional regulator with XRE-family HTH domain